ncbi:50S ribosomal protein L13 [Planococcaceae bacterium Storch 2/2-2]|nr:50S ribosomal protein L13 [Planococcaceae bacterium Storch 2/2-2]
MRTTFMAKGHEVERNWYVIDAEGQTLGRLASEIATLLRGKHKPTFTPHVDTGDHVIVINAEKIHLSGNKMQDKMYYRHTGYTGNMKERNAATMIEKSPERMIELAVKGMLPNGPLGRETAKKLHVYAGENHPHTAQQPEAFTLRG